MEDTSSIRPIVSVCENQVVATSRDVANFFGKRHDKVIERIKSLIEQMSDRLPKSGETVSPHRLLIFKETVEQRPNPSGGAPIASPAYRMTRDGFTLLAMSFTGARALRFKLSYIEAFNRMEAELRDRQLAAPTARRMLLAFDAAGRTANVTPVPESAAVIDPANATQVQTFLGEYLPADMLPEALGVIMRRLQSSAQILLAKGGRQ